MASHLPVVIFWCITAVLIHFTAASVIVIFDQILFIIPLCSIVMSLFYIKIITLSAYNVTNKAEHAVSKQISFKNNVALTFCCLIVMFPKYVLIVTCDASNNHVT